MPAFAARRLQASERDIVSAPEHPSGSPRELKRNFVRAVSHELRTPLNAILGFSELIAGSCGVSITQTQTAEYARIIHDSGQKLLKLVNQTLEIIRLDGDAVDLVIEPQSLEETLETVLSQLRPQLQAAGTTIETSGFENQPTIRADARCLHLILHNLVQNAAQHGPANGTAFIQVVRQGPYIQIEVSDQGSKLEQRTLDEMVNLFSQIWDWG